MKMKKGIILIAFGEKYLLEARFLIDSILTFNSIDISLLTFSDEVVPDGFPANILRIDRDEYYLKYFKNASRLESIKVYFLERVTLPYDINLYMDIDTFVVSSLDNLFEEFEISSKILGYANNVDVDWSRNDSGSLYPTKVLGYGYGSLNINAGILLFKKCPDLNSLIVKWSELYKINSDKYPLGGNHVVNDQSSLNAVLRLISSDLSDYFLIDNKIYNAQELMWPSMLNDGSYTHCKIFHSHLLFKYQSSDISLIVNNSPWLKRML